MKPLYLQDPALEGRMKATFINLARLLVLELDPVWHQE